MDTQKKQTKKKSDAGKGSRRRPKFISWEEWDERWDYAFGKKEN